MDFNQPELCFVCNRDVMDKGVSLSMATTLYSKTPILTNLTQLLGDAFMVVILEDDKICLRCMNLINRTDNLEQDLRKTQRIIRGFLNEKYDLNEEVGFSSFGEELEGPNDNYNKDDDDDNYIYDEESLLHSPTIYVKDDYSYQDEGYKANKYLKSDEEHSENAFDVRVKSEPVINSDQHLNSTDSHNVRGNCDHTISEALLKKLPEDDDTLMEKHSTGVGSSWSEVNHIVQESQGIVVLKLKKEKLSVGYKENDVPTSAPYASNDISPVNETSDKSFAIPTDDHSHLDEKRSEIKSLCDVSNSVKEIKDVSKSNNNSESSKGITGEASEAELPNIAAGKELPEEIKGKTYSSNPSKPKNHKCIKKEKERADSKVRKLRPILPKVTNVNEVLSSLYIIQHSDCNEILNENVKYNLSIKPESSEFFHNSKEIKSSDRDRESNLNQCILKETEQLNAITDDLNTHCNADLIDPIALKSHENNHLQDRFKCSFCLKSFKNKSCAKTHEVIHTGNFAHYCEFCGQGFATLPKLEQHRRKHTKEECYKCDVCGKKFLYKGTYWIHRKWHDNPFPYKCDDCGKPFKHSSRLSIHRRKHRGERPYKCSYCPLTFDVSTTLKRHVLLHTKQFPYKCIMCNQGFTTRYKYTNHLARKHDIFVEKPSIDPRDYKMAVCNSEKEKTGVESISSEKTVDFNETNCQVEILENSELIFNNSSDCRIEIILPPSSMLSDNSFSNINWLT